MNLKIASYNISGGFFNSSDTTEYLDKERVETVDDGLLKEIMDTVINEEIDVICFQEIITTERIKYIDRICENTDLKYYDYFELSECNIVKDTNCGIAILSKYPIEIIRKELFPNPNLSKTTKSGNTYYLYDKGYMVDRIKVKGEEITILNHHGFPYEVFDSTPEENPNVFKFFDKAIELAKPDVIVGDFNANNFMPLMEKTSEKYIRTIDSVTTVEGEKLDDILLPKGSYYTCKVLKLLSDHYMIITEIQ